MQRRSLSAALLVSTLAAFTACSGCGEKKRPDGGVGLIQSSAHAPAWTAQDQNGKSRSLSEFAGKPVVLYFYPKDDTPGCTKEACAFRDAWTKLQATGAQIVGVSLDGVASHAEFVKKYTLPFVLVADTDGKIADAYGVKRTMGYDARVTFVIDRTGTILKVFPDVDPAIHADEVLTVLAGLPKS
ncbi:MAG: peroxiredoxin [Polyangiales bacterium]